MKKVIIITGPTAGGKSAAAIQIALKTNGTIINADALQVYKTIPILSAQPNLKDLNTITHKLYGYISHDEALTNKFCVQTWLNKLEIEITTAHNNNLTPIIVGGSVMYIHTLINGLSEIPQLSKEILTEVDQQYTALGHVNFTTQVQRYNPDTPVDPQRIKRNYAFILQYGQSLQNIINTSPKKLILSGMNIHANVLLPPREKLYATCNSRFLDMLNDGAIEEVKSYTHTPIPDGILKATGFREILNYLNGKCNKEDMIKQSQQSTRNYAKRQTTWVKNKFTEFKFFENKIDLINHAML